MKAMFSEVYPLTTIDVSSFDTSNVTDMYAMFSENPNLVELDLSNFDTSKVTDMNKMFYLDPKLETLILGTNFNFLEGNDLEKSWKRDGDTTLYTAAELTNSYDGATMAGTYRAVVQLTITEEVRGSLADTNKDFTFTINVIKNGNGINGNQSYTGTHSGNLRFTNGVATFTLKHGQNMVLNLNSGVEYTITQVNDEEGYTLSKTNDSGILNDNIVSSFINTLEGTTPTGIFLDIIPFIIMIISGIGIIVWIKKFKYI